MQQHFCHVWKQGSFVWHNKKTSVRMCVWFYGIFYSYFVMLNTVFHCALQSDRGSFYRLPSTMYRKGSVYLSALQCAVNVYLAHKFTTHCDLALLSKSRSTALHIIECFFLSCSSVGYVTKNLHSALWGSEDATMHELTFLQQNLQWNFLTSDFESSSTRPALLYKWKKYSLETWRITHTSLCFLSSSLHSKHTNSCVKVK